MTVAPPTETVRVAIIGAGASGLSQIKQLLDAFRRDDVRSAGKQLELVCYEKGREVGGVWYVDEDKVKGKSKPCHSEVLPVDQSSGSEAGGRHSGINGHSGEGEKKHEESGLDRLVIWPKVYDEGDEPSAMYDGLRTNLPHDIMAFRDLPAPSQDPAAPRVDIPPSDASPPSGRSSSASTPPSTEPPVHFSSLYPPRREMQAYLESYARAFGLYKHIRFHTTVTRLYHTPDRRVDASAAEGANGHSKPLSTAKKWTVHSRSASGQASGEGELVEEFDYVCVANGHYADAWTPEVRGLRTFPGQILHSRFYNSPVPFSGKRVLVVGSFASGGDIARLMAVWNLNHSTSSDRNGHSSSDGEPNADKADNLAPIDIHVSCSSLTLYSTPTDDPSQPWGRYITYHPLISSVSASAVSFTDGSTLEDVDAILFATGYVFALPFCKRTDAPWRDDASTREEILSETLRSEDKGELGQWEAGGLKGQGMRTEGMDELLMFRKGDRSVAFPGLAYQVVPFPLVELQARLTALLWSGALTLPPAGSPELALPHNPSNPTSPVPSRDIHSPSNGVSQSSTGVEASDEANGEAQQAESKAETGQEKKPIRGAIAKRGQFVFNTPYEWEYSDHLMRLMLPAGSGVEGKELAEHWKRTEGWRRERRADKDLRKRILGF